MRTRELKEPESSRYEKLSERERHENREQEKERAEFV